MDTVPPSLRERAALLREEALSLLRGGVQEAIEAALGPAEVAGSVALDLMVWKDIDLYVHAEASDAARFRALGPALAAALERQGYRLARLALRDEHVLPDPAFPDTPGLYLALEFARPGADPWKLDLWGWDTTRHQAQRERHLELRRTLAGADRDLVLRIKELARARPGYRSVDVYAFALAGAGTTFEDFERFRREQVG